MAVTEIPNKFDIIPIHASDISNYLRCRRYWDWTSPARNNLRTKVQVYGLNPNLWFGNGIHYALEMYYHPMLKRDPVESFNTWFTYQWEGGTVSEDWLERTYDIWPTKINDDGFYKISGLKDLLPEPNQDEFHEYHELGLNMMAYYKDYSAKHDTMIEIVDCESMFSIPLGFEWKDIREDSPNYGKMLEVHARGKRDAIYHHLERDRYGIIDYKTAERIDDNYFLKLNKDPQCTTYIWASETEARLNDLPWTSIEEVTYTALRKAFPRPPTQLNSGLPSLDRSKESTTAEMFMEFVRDNGLTAWYEADSKAQGYYEFLVDKGEENFIIRYPVRRNKYEIEAQGRFMRMIAEEMLDSPNIYPHPTGGYDCVKCAFRAPCIASDDGSDWEDIIENNYEKNRGR